MEKNSTLNELAEFSINEKKDLKSLGFISYHSAQPSMYVVNNILNYSKALIIRKTKNLGKIEFIIN